MLVFQMDTTGLCRRGQQYEFRICLPKERLRPNNLTSTGSTASNHQSHRVVPSALFQSAGFVKRTTSRRDSQSSGSSVPSNGVTCRRSPSSVLPRKESVRKDAHSTDPPSGASTVAFSRTCPSRSHILRRSSSSTRELLDYLISENRDGVNGLRVNRDHLSRRDRTTVDPPKPFPRSITPAGRCLHTTTKGESPKPAPRASKEGRKRHNSMIVKTNKLKVVPIQPGGGDESAHGLVTIKMKPDDQGKFGFNVKGGADQNSPVLVSKVAPGTPADRCYPRLNEGDQVLLINGRDVSSMTHEQVVNFIRASRECHSGELVLTVKQNVYLGGEDYDGEPEFQYVPEGTVPSTGREQGALGESMLLLEEGLDAGSLVAQFEQLYRRKPGLALSEARKPDNEKKNRYRDISPYDTTRVMLTSATTGDYINASYVNMEIQGSGIINRYIACQGPLAGTCTDFWQMIWEQQSTLVVMLTTVVEQGRIKCHCYWPRLFETVDFGILQVTCLKEDETTGFAFREFKLVNTQYPEDERHITHMQYLAWPDHGVPDDSSEFLNFIKQVREARIGMVEPTVVHCSAGIGRTGVLILMETAQCLIEANEPVYPLDIVKAMRDQRAMMIQTASQYRFVCEAIQRVYSEGIVKPLPDYQQQR